MHLLHASGYFTSITYTLIRSYMPLSHNESKQQYNFIDFTISVQTYTAEDSVTEGSRDASILNNMGAMEDMDGTKDTALLLNTTEKRHKPPRKPPPLIKYINFLSWKCC